MKPVMGVFHKIMFLIWQHHKIKSTDYAYMHKDVMDSILYQYKTTTLTQNIFLFEIQFIFMPSGAL